MQVTAGQRSLSVLGRPTRESGVHALAAAQAAGWGGGAGLLDLGSTTATLGTVARLDGLGAVVHLAHPQQPDPDLERALLGSHASVLVSDVHPVARDWVLVGRTTAAHGPVVVDEAGLRDARGSLRGLGLNPRLVASSTPAEQRLALAGENGMLLVEATALPEGTQVLPVSERLVDPAPLWYGLVTAGPAPRFTSSAQVWLAVGPRDDHRGSLQQTLGVVADAGIDLQHLRSHRSDAGPHVFFTSFSCPSADVLDALVAQLGARGVRHRVLAVLPGDTFEPGPQDVTPVWTPDDDVAPRAGAAG